MPIVEQLKHTYSALGSFTRTWLNIAFCLAIAQLVVSVLFLGYAGDLFSLNLHHIGHLQLWRLITCFIYLGSFLFFLINTWFLVTVVDTVERSMERQDFIAFLAFSSVTLFGIAVVYGLPYVSTPLLMSFMVQYAAIDPYQPLSIWLGPCGTLSLYRYATPLLAMFPIVLFGNFETYLFGVLVGLVWIAIVKYLPSYESIDQPMREMASDVEQPACVPSSYQAARADLSVAPSPSAPLMQQPTQTTNLA